MPRTRTSRAPAASGGPAPTLAAVNARDRIEVPADPRDLPGSFHYRREIEVRFADTDAMGHVNNATLPDVPRDGAPRLLRGGHGPAAAARAHGASESMILAEVRLTYRSPAFYGETLTIEARVGRIGRTSFTQEYRITAPDEPLRARRAWSPSPTRSR